jgi:glyoxylase-like metal-dependent hydrolase (beta-lactamase superfamily II)
LRVRRIHGQLKRWRFVERGLGENRPSQTTGPHRPGSQPLAVHAVQNPISIRHEASPLRPSAAAIKRSCLFAGPQAKAVYSVAEPIALGNWASRPNKMTTQIEPIKIDFSISLPNGPTAKRFVYCYLLLSEHVTLVDTGVKGADSQIFRRLQELKRDPSEIRTVLLTHAHPDHIGSLADIRSHHPVQVLAHSAERSWIEDIQHQLRERPVPGFHQLVAGSSKVDRTLNDGDIVELGGGARCHVLHTPGHSPGGISIHVPTLHTLFTGDALPLPGDMLLYDDVRTYVRSIKRLQNIPEVRILYSSWHDPIHGSESVKTAMAESLDWLQRVHSAIRELAAQIGDSDRRALYSSVVKKLQLPPFADNLLAAKSIQSHLPWLGCENVAGL